MNLYTNLKNQRHQKLVEFPKIYASNKQELESKILDMGLGQTELEGAVMLTGGVFILESDIEPFNMMLAEYNDKLLQSIKDDQTGEGFIKDMFITELVKFNGDVGRVLTLLGLTEEQVTEDDSLSHGLSLALDELRQ